MVLALNMQDKPTKVVDTLVLTVDVSSCKKQPIRMNKQNAQTYESGIRDMSVVYTLIIKLLTSTVEYFSGAD